MNLFEMKQNHQAALDSADSIIRAAETAGRALTDSESTDLNAKMAEVNALTPQIKQREQFSTLAAQFPKGNVPSAAPSTARRNGKGFSAEYASEFGAWLKSRGKHVTSAMGEGADDDGGFKFPANRSAALYEGAVTGGSGPAGGFAVPSQVEGQFVPLAPPVMGVQSIASVVPTVMDTRYPRKDIFGTAAGKAESTTAAPSSFGGNDPSLGQFTLSAYMVGHSEDASWELLQDVAQFQGFISDDVLLSIAILKESWYVNGTGPAQGLIGNTGTGVTAAPADAAGNLLSIASTFDVMGTLNPYYYEGASWLMSVPTSIALRKAQVQSNLFEPVFTRVGKQDYLHGYPVTYSYAMPAIASLATPVLFGDFKRGYLIGERGGAGVNIKILDQPKALQGLLTVLGYQRVDGRVRRAEAIQAITLHV